MFIFFKTRHPAQRPTDPGDQSHRPLVGAHLKPEQARYGLAHKNLHYEDPNLRP